MNGSLHTAVEGFLAHKRALGRKYNSEEYELRLLVRYCAGRGVTSVSELTPTLLDDFLGSRPRARPRSFNHLLGVVRGFAGWAVTQELLDAPPLQARPRKVTSARIPFLFSPAQARQLLAAAAALPDNSRARDRGPAYHAIFALCYGLGLRAGEACGLRLGDIDASRQLLAVRGGKFGKSRLVPHGPRISELLTRQAQRRQACGGVPPQAPLFSFNGRKAVNPTSASQVFHRLVTDLDFPVPGGVSPPVLHCLRHSFAVACLLRWYRQGIDPQDRLIRLSVFMGHVSPLSTAVYLTESSGIASGERGLAALAAMQAIGMN